MISIPRRLRLLLLAIGWKVPIQEQHVDALADKIGRELDEDGKHPSERSAKGGGTQPGRSH